MISAHPAPIEPLELDTNYYAFGIRAFALPLDAQLDLDGSCVIDVSFVIQ